MCIGTYRRMHFLDLQQLDCWRNGCRNLISTYSFMSPTVSLCTLTWICYNLDHWQSCNKYCNVIGHWQVSLYLQDFHGHLQGLPSGSSNTKVYDLVRHCLVGFYDLEDLRALIEPLLRSGFYIESFSLLNHRNLNSVYYIDVTLYWEYSNFVNRTPLSL